MSQDQLAEVRERYKQGSSSVNDLARELAQVSTHTCSQRVFTMELVLILTQRITMEDVCDAH